MQQISVALIFLIFDHLILLIICHLDDEVQLKEVTMSRMVFCTYYLVYLVKNKTFQVSSQCPLHQKEYFRMLCTTALTFSFPTVRGSFFLWLLLISLLSTYSNSLLPLKSITPEIACWSFLQIYTMLWYQSKMKLSNFYILNAKQPGWYLDFNISLIWWFQAIIYND